MTRYTSIDAFNAETFEGDVTVNAGSVNTMIVHQNAAPNEHPLSTTEAATLANLKYCLDRQKIRQLVQMWVIECGESNAAPTNPLVLVLPANVDKDATQSLAEGCGKMILKPHLSRYLGDDPAHSEAMRNAFENIHVQWPESFSSVETGLKLLIGELYREIGLPPRGYTPEDIAKAIRRHGLHWVLHCDFRLERWNDSTESLLKGWLDLWAEMPKLLPQQSVLVLISLELGGNDNQIPASMQNYIQQLNPWEPLQEDEDLAEIEWRDRPLIFMSEPLTKISKSDFEAWRRSGIRNGFRLMKVTRDDFHPDYSDEESIVSAVISRLGDGNSWHMSDVDRAITYYFFGKQN